MESNDFMNRNKQEQGGYDQKTKNASLEEKNLHP